MSKDNVTPTPAIGDEEPMEEPTIQEQLRKFSGRPIEDRKKWYVPVADAYDKARPKYPQSICDRILGLANISNDSKSEVKILEIGCGPGTATINFAPRGYDMLCVEPNPAFCDIARKNCSKYPNVRITTMAFEEWEPAGDEQFDLVIAANAFHWVQPEVGYQKVAKALKPDGHFALLWNMNLEPTREVWEKYLQPFFEGSLVPILSKRYEGPARQKEILTELGQTMEKSGYFDGPTIESMECNHTYTHEDYLTLQRTYSHVVALSKEDSSKFFDGLRQALEKIPVVNDEDAVTKQIQLFNLCGFQIAKKKA